MKKQIEIEITRDNFGSKKFIINKDKGVVVCILSNTRLNRSCCDKIEFVGKAKVSPTDTFDVKIGKVIAQERAEFKFYKCLRSNIKQDIDFYEKRIIELENQIRINREYINTASKRVLDLAIKQGIISSDLKKY